MMRPWILYVQKQTKQPGLVARPAVPALGRPGHTGQDDSVEAAPHFLSLSSSLSKAGASTLGPSHLPTNFGICQVPQNNKNHWSFHQNCTRLWGSFYDSRTSSSISAFSWSAEGPECPGIFQETGLARLSRILS